MDPISNDASSEETKSSQKTLDMKDVNFTSKEILFLKMIDRFFRNTSQDKKNKMYNIVEGESKISLRLLDWFVTRYAYKYKICYQHENEDFNVHISYKAQLKSYKKRYFDPFRRRKKFNYNYDKTDKSKTMRTTIGQLNFFRWAFMNGIVGYVDKNYDTILQSMIKSNKDDKKRKIEEKKNIQSVKEMRGKQQLIVKRRGVKVEARSRIDDEHFKIVLSFD